MSTIDSSRPGVFINKAKNGYVVEYTYRDETGSQYTQMYVFSTLDDLVDWMLVGGAFS